MAERSKALRSRLQKEMSSSSPLSAVAIKPVL